MTTESKFKAGDRVRVKNDPTRTGTVTEVFPSSYSQEDTWVYVAWDNGWIESRAERYLFALPTEPQPLIDGPDPDLASDIEFKTWVDSVNMEQDNPENIFCVDCDQQLTGATLFQRCPRHADEYIHSTDYAVRYALDFRRGAFDINKPLPRPDSEGFGYVNAGMAADSNEQWQRLGDKLAVRNWNVLTAFRYHNAVVVLCGYGTPVCYYVVHPDTKLAKISRGGMFSGYADETIIYSAKINPLISNPRGGIREDTYAANDGVMPLDYTATFFDTEHRQIAKAVLYWTDGKRRLRIAMSPFGCTFTTDNTLKAINPFSIALISMSNELRNLTAAPIGW